MDGDDHYYGFPRQPAKSPQIRGRELLGMASLKEQHENSLAAD
jgi:hypothetical protein